MYDPVATAPGSVTTHPASVKRSLEVTDQHDVPGFHSARDDQSFIIQPVVVVDQIFGEVGKLDGCRAVQGLLPNVVYAVVLCQERQGVAIRSPANNLVVRIWQRKGL